MSNSAFQDQLCVIEEELSTYREISFTLASAATLSGYGSPSKIDSEVRGVVSQKISELEQQHRLLSAELQRYG